MADNTTYQSAVLATPPAGTKVSADEATSDNALMQRMKLAYSADGDDTHVQADVDGLRINPGDAINTYGVQSSVPSGNTVTIVSYVAGAGWRFTGFIAGGEVDGRFFIQYDGVTKYQRRTNISERNAELILPNPDAAAGGTTVTLKVENMGEVSGTFEGTLLGV